MNYEQVFVPTDDHDIVVKNPATVLSQRVLAAGEALEFVKIEVHARGGSYREFGRGFSLTHDEGLSDAEKKSGANSLASDIVEVCAEGQAAYEKPVNWKVTGYDNPDKGKPKVLFSETFKVSSLNRNPTLKETESNSLIETNKLLRLIASDEHKKSMDTSELLLRIITPVSTMAGNIAEKIRPSDAEMAHRTRMAEMELAAAVAKAEAVGKQARSQATNETVRYIFDQMPIDELGEAAKLAAQHLLEKHRAEQAEKRRKETESKKENKADPASSEKHVHDTTPTPGPTPPDYSHLCHGSRTLSEIIEGRRDALALALGDDWPLFSALAEQTDQDTFAAQADAAYSSFSKRDPVELMTVFTRMNVALSEDGDGRRMDELQAFLKDSGILK